MPRARSLRSLTISRRRNTSPGPPSPTFSETTNVSAMNFGPDGPEKIITRADLKASVQGYGDLLDKCAGYRSALMNMSRATALFADAMETCATLKGPTYEAGTRLQATSGLHHLMGNHWHVMAETLDKQFERPLRQHLEGYRSIVAERSNTYEKALKEKSRIIQQTEHDNMHKKGRNLQSFRETLNVLQRQVDELDDLKVQHYQEIIEHEEEVWDVVQAKMCLLVRSTLDVFDRFTAKASDPVIEPMLQAVPDPFDSYGPQTAEDKIFSILPPLSVMASAPSATPSPITSSTPELESDGTTSGKSSWTTAGGFFPEGSASWGEVTASPASSPPSLTSMPGSMPASPPIASPSMSLPAVNRRHSYPVAPVLVTHAHRKSESKLRSVLAVIDESRNYLNGEAAEPGEPAAPSGTNGGTHSAGTLTPLSYSHPTPTSTLFSPAPAAVNRHLTMTDEVPWASTGLNLPSRPERSPSIDDVTPRNSGFRPLSPSSPPPPDTPVARRSRSPQSDNTVS